MNKRLGSLKTLTVAFAGIACGLAHAADLLLPPQQAPIVTPVPVYNWTGIYVGLNAGYGLGQQLPGSLFGDSFSAFNYNANGWLGGATAGAQIQSGHTVIGIEGDIDWANITGAGTGPIAFNGFQIGTATLSSTLSSVSTIRTRIGYAADNWLFYITGWLCCWQSDIEYHVIYFCL